MIRMLFYWTNKLTLKKGDKDIFMFDGKSYVNGSKKTKEIVCAQLQQSAP
jgi:hypothetical protein